MDVKINRNFGIYAAIVRLKQGESIRGIESNQIALVSVQRRSSGYAVEVEYETEDVDGHFTNRHSLLVDSVKEAVDFFDQYNIGEVTWIQAAQAERLRGVA